MMNVTIACPEAMMADANELATALAFSRADARTFRAVRRCDEDANPYAAASFRADASWIMTQVTSSRTTVVCATEHVDALNYTTEFDIRSANSQDSTGTLFALISFVSDGTFDPKRLGLMSFEPCQADTVQELRSDRIQFVFRGDGAAVLEKLGLSPVLPLC